LAIFYKTVTALSGIDVEMRINEAWCSSCSVAAQQMSSGE